MSDAGFVVVTWPKSQLVMDDEDFAECTLINDEAGLEKFGPAAYYVPLHIFMRTYPESEQ